VIKKTAEGLRTADPMMVSVQIQDLLITPLARLEVGTLCDLLALSVCDDLSRPTLRDLGRFRDRVAREYADLPGGPVLDGFLDEIGSVAPARTPACLREILLSPDAERLPATSQERLAALGAAFEGVEPDGVKLGTAARTRVQKPHVPQNRRAPSKRTARRTAAPRAPASSRDPQRDQWIKEDVLHRLSNYGSRGLKQAVLVAGSLHRSPFADLGRDEIMGVLRRLKDQGVLLHSAGRWSRKGRW